MNTVENKKMLDSILVVEVGGISCLKYSFMTTTSSSVLKRETGRRRGGVVVVLTGAAVRGRGHSNDDDDDDDNDDDDDDNDAGDGVRGGFLRARRVKPLLTITAGRVGRLRSCQASIIATNGSTLLPITSGHTLPAGNLDGVTPILALTLASIFANIEGCFEFTFTR
ncbi:hypothetical protein M0804_009628 [Polistes exclamans]|nr:hypothetical protein M0804_009628 [Polistes exclamans]